MINLKTRSRILDEVLNRVVGKESNADTLPYVLKRFADSRGMASATAAAQLATKQVLESVSQNGSTMVPVDIDAICKLLVVRLEGIASSARPAPGYSARPRAPRVGHTGSIRFEGARPVVTIPDHIDYATARLSVAHEIGHLLVHSRDGKPDQATLRLPSEADEEAIAEYVGRMLLLPPSMWQNYRPSLNLAEYAVAQSSLARVTVGAPTRTVMSPWLAFQARC